MLTAERTLLFEGASRADMTIGPAAAVRGRNKSLPRRFTARHFRGCVGNLFTARGSRPRRLGPRLRVPLGGRFLNAHVAGRFDGIWPGNFRRQRSTRWADGEELPRAATGSH